MKLRVLSAFAIAVGLGLLLALVVVAQAGPATGAAAARRSTSLGPGEPSPILFTPGFTICLPLVARNHDPYFYFDDFSDPNSGWYVGDSDTWTGGYLAGEYQIVLKKPYSGAMASPYLLLPGSYRVEVDARQASSVASSYGLVFGIQWSGTAYGAYQFVVDPGDRRYTLQERSVGGAWSTLIDWTYSAAIQPDLATNHVRVDRTGTAIDLYINGAQVASYMDDTYTGEGRGAGVRAYSSDSAPVDVRFDNFAAYRTP